MRPPCRQNYRKAPPSASNPADTAGSQPTSIHVLPPLVYKIQPSEFKALVQKLTGHSGSPGDDANKNHHQPALPAPAPETNNGLTPAVNETNQAMPGVKNNEEVVVEYSPESESSSHSWPYFPPAATDPEFDSDFDVETPDFLMPVTPELVFDPPNWINAVYGDVRVGCSSSTPNGSRPAPSIF